MNAVEIEAAISELALQVRSPDAAKRNPGLVVDQPKSPGVALPAQQYQANQPVRDG